MRIAVCDCSLPDMERLCEILEKYYIGGSDTINIIGYSNINRLVSDLLFSKYEYVFLDESMGNFKATAPRLLNTKRMMVLILTGRTCQGAAAGYGTGADAFIPKPYSESNVKDVLDKCLPHDPSYIMIHHVDEYYRVPLNSITYVESSPNGCIIHTFDKQTHRVYDYSLKRIKDILGERFVTINNHNIVALRYIDRIEDNIVLVTGESLEISKSKKAAAIRLILESKELERQQRLY